MKSDRIKLVLIGTVTYSIVTFPLAAIWHAVLFRSLYDRFGYFEGDPSFALGFLTILLQGIILSLLYSRLSLSGGGIAKGLTFAMALGVFFWTSHVLAFVAKQSVRDAPSFVLIESAYLVIQFGLFGILIGTISDRLRARSNGNTASAT